jgi:hypothetical protein
MVQAEVPWRGAEGSIQALTMGEKPTEKGEKDETYQRVERSWGAFTRPLALPMGVDTSKVIADRQGRAADHQASPGTGCKGTMIPVKAE